MGAGKRRLRLISQSRGEGEKKDTAKSGLRGGRGHPEEEEGQKEEVSGGGLPRATPSSVFATKQLQQSCKLDLSRK